MARISVLGQAGDFLPTFKTVVKTRKGKKRRKRVRSLPEHKDGVTPGQEWTHREILAIRTLANPATSSVADAARVCKCRSRLIEKYQRNPYFQQEVLKLTNSNLLNHRARVFQAVIDAAINGSAGDRTLYCRLTGDLKDEKVIKAEQHAHHTFGNMSQEELDEWLEDEVRDTPGEIDKLIDDTNPEGEEED